MPARVVAYSTFVAVRRLSGQLFLVAHGHDSPNTPFGLPQPQRRVGAVTRMSDRANLKCSAVLRFLVDIYSCILSTNSLEWEVGMAGQLDKQLKVHP
jgi:hypothetical protein